MTRPDVSPLQFLPPRGQRNPDKVLEAFLDFLAARGTSLYPAQEEAVLELFAGRHVILNTPTGSGKTLVALALQFKALAEGKRAFYTTPIKALASEKFFALCKDFGSELVGMQTGDASINRDAPLICCTAEILANVALREGRRALVDYAVLDEFHYFADKDRGVAWEVPLLALPQTTFLLMSATIGNPEVFQKRLTQLTNRETSLVRSNDRPVPLEFEYREQFLHETLEELVEGGRYPVYVVCFTQRSAAEQAQNLMSTNYCTKEEKQAISTALLGTRFDSPYGKEVNKYVRHGVGLHHAGLLPKYRLLMEKLAQKGLLKIICGTDTLGVGINVPIRTVVFTQLCKFDGTKTAILSVRDFKQISGRAGRKGFDDKGYVLALCPEHVAENRRLDAKRTSDPSRKIKVVYKKPPERGFVPWDKDTFQRLQEKNPEPLGSQFEVTHSMLLALLQGETNYKRGGYGRLLELLEDSMLGPSQKLQQRALAKVLFRSLLQAGVLELAPRAGKSAGKTVRLAEGLDRDFSLHHTLGLYALETFDKLDREAQSYPYDVVTLVESVLEDPDIVLARQLDKLKQLKLAELKQQGKEYEERMAELEKLEYPKPLRDFVYDSFNAFAKAHPWVGTANVRPKSVARELYELYYSFDDYVKEYGLERSEGVLLRYLSDAYKALVQLVPEVHKSPEVWDAIGFLRTTLGRVDTSLVDEWESLGRAPAEKTPSESEERAPRNPLEDPRAVAARIRSELHLLVKALAARDWEQCARAVAPQPEDPWTPERFEAAMADYYDEYDALRSDAYARRPHFTQLQASQGGRRFTARQILVDPAEDNLWVVEVTVDLDLPRDPQDPLVHLQRLGR